jgi:hypothetical protein
VTDITLTDVKVLDAAEDESFLSELLAAWTTHGRSGDFQTYAATPVHDAQASLARMLDKGLVEIYAIDGGRVLSTAEALAVATDDTTWTSSRQHELALSITDRGSDVLGGVWATYFDAEGRPVSRGD